MFCFVFLLSLYHIPARPHRFKGGTGAEIFSFSREPFPCAVV